MFQTNKYKLLKVNECYLPTLTTENYYSTKKKKTLFYPNRAKLSNVIVVLLLLRATTLSTNKNFNLYIYISYFSQTYQKLF